MRESRDRILTSHAGSLPRPDALIEANRARESGEALDERPSRPQLRAAVADVVRRQRDLGIDVPGDGEFGKSMGAPRELPGVVELLASIAWAASSWARPGLYDMPARRSRPGEVVLTSFADRRDRLTFAAAYADPDSGDHHRAPGRPLAGLRRAAHLHRAGGDPGRHRQHEGRAGGRRASRRASSPPSRRAARRGSPTGTTRPRRSSCSPAPTPCAKSTRPSSTPGSSSSSTTRPSPRTGTWSIPSPRWRTTGSSPWSAWRRSTTRSAACPRTACASISAGGAGTAPTRRTFPCATSST